MRTGSIYVVSGTNPYCSPVLKSDPLVNQEFDCHGQPAWGLVLARSIVSVPLGLCSVGILTDCNCYDTSFASTDIYPNRYFSGSLMTPTNFNTYLNASAISVQT